MKLNFYGILGLIPGLLMATGMMAFVLYPGETVVQNVWLQEAIRADGPVVTVRFVETRTTYFDRPELPVDNPVIAAVQTEPVEEGTVAVYFRQPDNAIDEIPEAVDLVVTTNKNYRMEPQVQPLLLPETPE